MKFFLPVIVFVVTVMFAPQHASEAGVDLITASEDSMTVINQAGLVPVAEEQVVAQEKNMAELPVVIDDKQLAEIPGVLGRLLEL